LSPFDNCENTVPKENVKLPQNRPYPHISLNQTSHRRCTGALFVVEHFVSTVCKTFTLFFITTSAVHSAKEQCFSLTINQHRQPNFNKTNRAIYFSCHDLSQVLGGMIEYKQIYSIVSSFSPINLITQPEFTCSCSSK